MKEIKPFWQTKTLQQMNRSEWESICDGCAKCCLHKFIEDDETESPRATEHIQPDEELHYTDIACQYLDDDTCQCTQYSQRTSLVPSCVSLTFDNLKDIYFMPPSCSYRLLHEGKGLPHWHPLRHQGNPAMMHQAGMSVRNKVICETRVDLDDFQQHIVVWPLQLIE